MKTLLFALAVAAILSQSVHTWFVFESFSNIKEKWLRVSQSVLFCGIISIAILSFVYLGKEKLALAGAILEFIFNVYYYAKDFFEKGFKNFTGTPEEIRAKKRNSVLSFWRRYWISVIISGAVIPAAIYVLSKLFAEVG